MRATTIFTCPLSHASTAFQSHRWDEVRRSRQCEDRGRHAPDGRITVAGRLLYVGHGTVLIELDGVRLLTDPVLRPRVWHLRRRVPLDSAELDRIDAALVSHVHFDHLDLPSLRLLGTAVTIVVPPGCRRLVRGFEDVREVDVGDEVRVGEVTIEATPAVHRSARLVRTSGPSLG